VNQTCHSSSEIDSKAKEVKLCLLGALFDTGNPGLSQLADLSIKVPKGL